MTCTGRCAHVTGVFFCIFLLASKHGVGVERNWKTERSILCIILQASSWPSINAIMVKWFAGWKEDWLSKAQSGHLLAHLGWVYIMLKYQMKDCTISSLHSLVLELQK